MDTHYVCDCLSFYESFSPRLVQRQIKKNRLINLKMEQKLKMKYCFSCGNHGHYKSECENSKSVYMHHYNRNHDIKYLLDMTETMMEKKTNKVYFCSICHNAYTEKVKFIEHLYGYCFGLNFVHN